jgi:hypothetical protein
MAGPNSVAASSNPPGDFSPNKKAGSAAMSCQAAKPNHSPCNLKLVSLKDATGKVEVTADAKPAPPLPAALPADKQALASGHALVLEVLSAVKTSGQKFDPAKVAKITAKATYDGGPCAAQHAKNAITIEPANLEPTDPIKARTVCGATSADLSIVGHAHPMDNPSGLQRGILQFISFFDWSERYVKELTVAFHSCGMGQANPNGPLVIAVGLVRIYRDDVYELTLKGPAIGKKKVLANNDWANYSNTSVLAPGGASKMAFGSGTKESPTTTTITTTPNRVTGQPSVTMTTAPTKLDNNWQVSLKRNGVPLEMVDMFQSLIKKLVEQANGVLNLIDEIKSAIPKVGVWIDCSVSFMETELTLAWGRRRASAGWNSSRYQWLESYLDGRVKITFITFGWSLKAGFEASSSSIIDWFIKRKAFELRAIFLVTVTASVAVDAKLNLRGADLPEENGEIEPVSLTGKVEVKAGGEIKVNIAGIALVDAAVGVKLAATLKAGLKVPFDIEIDGKWGKTTFYAKFCSGSHISPEVEQDLLPGFSCPNKWRWLRHPGAGASGSW